MYTINVVYTSAVTLQTNNLHPQPSSKSYSTTAIVSSDSTSTAGNAFKPRYALAFLSKSKVWPYKNSRLRRFYGLRSRRLQRGGLFRRFVLVSTTRKWTLARRLIRPVRRRSGGGLGGSGSGGGSLAYGRPAKRRYRQAFYTKQQLRAFHGKVKERTFRKLYSTHRATAAKRNQAFFAALESRLDRVLFRRRVLPTIFACHQLIHHHGIRINSTASIPTTRSGTDGSLEYSPNAQVRVGDIVSVPLKTWKAFYWDLYCRVYYRRWGLYILRRRLYNQLKRKQRLLFAGQSSSLIDIRPSVAQRNIGGTDRVLFDSEALASVDDSEFDKYQALTQLQKRYIAGSLFSPQTLRGSGSFDTIEGGEAAKASSLSSSALLRFLIQRQAKKERRRKFPRLKSVHWYVPTYLHRDFRTLRAVRIKSPSTDDIHHSFQASLGKLHSFYRSRGF